MHEIWESCKRKALSYFHEMQLEGILPDKVTYSSVVEACISEEALAQGKRIHSCIRKSGLDSGIVVATALMNLYNICGGWEEGHRIFDKMQGKNLVSWNSILSSFCWQGNSKGTLHLLLEMEAEGLMPNNVTCVSIVGMFANTEVLSGTKWIHSYAICRNLDPDMLVGNALIDSYGKCGSLEHATQVFDHMPNRNVVSWSAMIAGFSQQDHGKITLYIFQQMNLERVLPNGITFISLLYACISDGDVSEGKRIHAFILDRGLEYDMVVSNGLINMYGKCGSLDMAQRIFDGMHEPDVISWTALLSSYIQHGYHKNAALLLQKMQMKDVVPDEFIYASIIDACASAAVLAEAKWMHALLVDNQCESFSDVEHALVNMYGKCGSLGDAQRMFQKVDTQNIISWTAMIATYAQHNCAKEALQLFEEMQSRGMMPNRVTFLSIIDACADQAALHEGMEMHTRVRECGLDEEIIIGNALINMYGKCGSLQRAQITFSEMPEHNIISWNTIIGAYAQHGFYKEALGLFQQMHFDGQMPSDVTLVNTISACSRAGLVDEACYLFVSARRVYALALIVEHYNCMFDVLGRAGKLDELNDFIHNMVLLPTTASWTAFLGACVMHGDMEQAKFAAKCAVESDPKKAGPYVLLSNICAVPSDEWAGIG